MKKRKQASSAKPRGTRGGHPAPPKGRAKNVSRVTKSKGSRAAASGKALVAKESSPAALTLSAECMVAEAAALKDRLVALLEEPLPVTLDISSLQRIDTAGLQVITAFVRDRAALGHAVTWQGEAPVLKTAAQLLGLTSLLRLPI
jgi:ABC-type transporter Mla MlaB component